MQALQRRCSGSLYRVLGVPPSASTPEIKKAYHKAALRCHPDKPGGSTDQFKLVQEAHSVLIDDERRNIYDTFGREGMKHLGDSEMGAAMASTMANNPMLMRFAGCLMLLFSLLVLIFLSLVVVKIDKRKSWSWVAIFSPVWLVMAVFGLSFIAHIVETVREKRLENTLGILSGIVFFAAVSCVCRALDHKMSWQSAFVPIFIFMTLVSISGLFSMRPANYERLLRLSQVEDFDKRPGYFRFVLIGLFEMICTWSTLVLVYLRITSSSFTHTSFWIIFLPAILRTCLPGVVGVFTVILCNPQGDNVTCKDRMLHLFGILFTTSLNAYTVLMIAAKCEQDYNTRNPSTHITAGVCCILLFIANALAIFSSCGACLSGAAGPDDQRPMEATFTTPGDADCATEADVRVSSGDAGSAHSPATTDVIISDGAAREEAPLLSSNDID